MRLGLISPLLYPLAGVVLIIAVWALACWFFNIPTVVLPSPDKVLRSLIIDTDSDHNTNDTAMRVAKMFVSEVFRGRYVRMPSVTEFPNVERLNAFVSRELPELEKKLAPTGLDRPALKPVSAPRRRRRLST